MRNDTFIENLKILIKITIDFNDKLYEQIIKKRYSEQQSKRIENYVKYRNHDIRMNKRQRKQNNSKITFMKLNVVIFK